MCSGISEDAEYWRDVQHGSMSCLVCAYVKLTIERSFYIKKIHPIQKDETGVV